jgi:amino acid transporter
MVFSTAVALGLVLSPESLIVLGNGVGRGGVFFILAVSLASLVHVPNVVSLSMASLAGGETRLLKATFGPVAAGASLFSSRVFFTICALPVLLSTAGFVFNETFLYWFPNFLFAHLLLIFIAVLNIARRKAAEAMQAVFVAVAVGGILLLSVAGLLKAPDAFLTLSPEGTGDSVSAMFPAVLLFVGFDLMYLSGRRVPEEARSAMTAIILSAMVFVLWGLASFFHVPLATLATTTIPYSKAARGVMGDAGRFVIGAVVISGVAGAVNALFLGVGRMMTEMAAEGLLPRPFLLGEKRDAAPVIALAAAGAGLMLAGFAGETRLLVYLKGSALFWLLHYAVVHASVMIVLRDGKPRSIYMTALTGVLLFTASFVGLVCISGEKGELIRSMLYIMGSATLISGAMAVHHLKKTET